jgi:hypothetical protein
LEKKRKWEAGSENLRQLDDTHTRTSERKREREKKKADRNDPKNPVSFLLPSPNAARLLGEMNMGTIAYNADAQDSIRHSKGKTQQNPKNHRKPKTNPKKKTPPPTLVTAWVKPNLLFEPNSFLDEQKQKGEKRKCRSWNEEEQEQETEKLERSKKRSSSSARPFRRLQSSLLITALISCKSSCVIA